MMTPDCGASSVPGLAFAPDASKFQNKIEIVPKFSFWNNLRNCSVVA
jgi:hypothetical protein